MNVPFRPPASKPERLVIAASFPPKTRPGLFAAGLVNLQLLVGAV